MSNTEVKLEEKARQFWATYFCGCGDPEAAADAFREIMNLFEERDFDGHISICLNFEKWQEYEKKHGNGLTYCILYWLGGMELTEHGGSVGGCWMTDLGKYVRLQVLTAPTGEFDF